MRIVQRGRSIALFGLYFFEEDMSVFVFRIEPEDDFLALDGETFVDAGFSLAGEYLLMNSERLLYHFFLDVVHISIIGGFIIPLY